MTEWLDPSVTDELDPDKRDPELDIYSPSCPNKPPFSAEFVARFRAAQIARNRKITHWVQEMLDSLRKRSALLLMRSEQKHLTSTFAANIFMLHVF